MKAALPNAGQYSMADIAEALGISKQAAQKRSNKEEWPSERAGRGMIYPLSSLPKDVREALQRWAMKQAMATLPATVSMTPEALPVVQEVKLPAVRKTVAADAASAAQLLVRDARLAILNAVKGAVDGHALSVSKAVSAWLDALADGSMPVAQQLWCAIANVKNGFAWEVTYTAGGPTATPLAGQSIAHFAAKLSKRTIQRWVDEQRAGGDDALIPGRREKDLKIPAWAPFFLAEMQRPQKPTKQDAYIKMADKLNGLGWKAHRGTGTCKLAEYPDYSTVCRWYNKKYSKLDARKGRNTGSAMNPYKFAHKRTSEGMWPLLEVHSDGWNTKFTAPHPVSGKFVTFEVWHSHDVATRKAYGQPVCRVRRGWRAGGLADRQHRFSEERPGGIRPVSIDCRSPWHDHRAQHPRQ
jgi:putative transposase